MVLEKMNRFLQTQSCKRRCELNLTFHDSNRWQDKMCKSYSWTKLSKKNPLEENVLMSVVGIQYIILFKNEIHIKKSLPGQLVCPNLIDFYIIRCYHDNLPLNQHPSLLLLIMISKKYWMLNHVKACSHVSIRFNTIYIHSFNHQNNSMRQVLLVYPFYRYIHWDSEIDELVHY